MNNTPHVERYRHRSVDASPEASAAARSAWAPMPHLPARLGRAAAARCATSPRCGTSSAPTRYPIYFVGATPFNLLGLDRWVRNFSYVTYYDGWDGAHPRVFSPKHKPYIEFEQRRGDQQLATGQSRGAGPHVPPRTAGPTPEGCHGVLRRRDRADLR